MYIREFLQEDPELSQTTTVDEATYERKHQELASYRHISRGGTARTRSVRLRCEARCFKWRLPQAIRLARMLCIPARYSGTHLVICWRPTGRVVKEQTLVIKTLNRNQV
jgi:hypothetical protein